MDEEALLMRARQGDRDAFARLAATHRAALHRAAWWVLRDEEEALDATQDALVRAFRFLGRFDGRSSFATWARRIAVNVALDRRARRGRPGAAGALPDDGLVEDERAPAPGEDLERAETRALVRAAIERLPPAQRDAVVLRDVEGLSYEEIARTLGIAKGTVMSRIYYGRQTLRAALAARFGAPAGGAP